MKILYHHRIASKDGQYVHVDEIIEALKKLGHEIVLVEPQVSKSAKFGSDGGWISWLRCRLPKAFFEFLEFSYSFLVFLKLAVAIIKHKPDAIYERFNLFMPAGIWAKKLFNLKLILEVNSPLYDERMQYGGISLAKLARWTECYTWRNADHLCPVTYVLADYLKKAGVEEKKITVIPNGVDPQKFSSASLSFRQLDHQNTLILGFVGFCREWHQLDNILELIAKLEKKHIKLLILGDGPASASLIEKAKALKIENQLEITGIVERSAMPDWLDKIDIALQPQVTPWSSPLKLIEYLAKGKAIVAPNTPNIRELLTHNKNALLYDTNSVFEISDCITQIIEDKNLREKLQQGAINTISEKRLTWENNAKQIEGIFQSLILNKVIPVKNIE